MSGIRFDNDTINFQDGVQQPINTYAAFTVAVNTYRGNTRLTIPSRLRNLYPENDRVALMVDPKTNQYFLDFKSQEVIEGYNYKYAKLVSTGGGFFITIPAHWIRPYQPKSAQLIQDRDFKAKYKVILYD